MQVINLDNHKIFDLIWQNKSEQIFDFILSDGTYHEIKVRSNYGFPIIVDKDNIPNTKESQYSCIRYCISLLIKRIRELLVEKYKFVFDFKNIRQLILDIRQEKSGFNETIYKLSVTLIKEYETDNDSKLTNPKTIKKIKDGKLVVCYLHEFYFDNISIFGDINLKSSTTLPPDIFNQINNNFYIPQPQQINEEKINYKTIFEFSDKLIHFEINKNKYIYDLELNELIYN